MERVLKISVLALFLSLATAYKDFEFSENQLERIHDDPYKATQEIKLINADSVEQFQLDLSPYIYWSGVIQLRNVDEGIDLDGNCGGHLGVMHPFRDAAYCLKFMELDMQDRRAITLELRFEGPYGTPLQMYVPIFRDDANVEGRDKYSSKVLRLEPFSSDQFNSLRVEPKIMDFTAQWLKAVLDKPVTQKGDVFVTYPVIPSDDNFIELYKSVRDNGVPEGPRLTGRRRLTRSS